MEENRALRGVFIRGRRRREEPETNSTMKSSMICVILKILISSVVLY
jgi:hypothetical protein